MYVPLNDLPTLIFEALKARGYNKKDIEVKAKNSVSISVGGWEGKRGYTDVINMRTRSIVQHTGSWGGPNIFSHRNKVDMSDSNIEITPDTVIIQGYSGYKPLASCYCHESWLSRFGSTATEETTEREKKVLGWFVSYKASYRKPWVDAEPPELINGLVNRGLLKRNRAGALSITTAGKNVVR